MDRLAQLLAYNRQGLIPGPQESEEEFFRRAQYCLNLKAELSPEVAVIDLEVSKKMMQEVVSQTREFFDIAPEWVPIAFSNQGLAPWHGGCAWIFQLTMDKPTAAFFQLRKAFANSATYLGIYHRNELIAHEACHVSRMLFNEPKFEELLAYKTSHSAFRRWWGPIVQAPLELFILLILFVFAVAIDFFGAGFEQLSLWSKGILLLYVGAGIVRLWWRQKQYSSALKNLEKALGSVWKARAVIFRLRDREIMQFSQGDVESILAYASEQQELRWQVIKSYFK